MIEDYVVFAQKDWEIQQLLEKLGMFTAGSVSKNMWGKKADVLWEVWKWRHNNFKFCTIWNRTDFVSFVSELMRDLFKNLNHFIIIS